MVSQRLYRTQILLEPEQHAALAQIARRESRSVSDLVREIVECELKRREVAKEERLKRRLEWLEQVERHQQEILDSRGGVPIDIDMVAYINEMREERDREILGRGFDRP